jgi:hypothetical protein
MPAEQGVRTNEKRLPARAAQNPAGRRKENAVACFQLWTGDLAAKNRQLVSKHHDLQLLELARAQPQRRNRKRSRNNRYSNDTTKKRPPSTRTETSRLYGGETNVDAPLERQTDLRTPRGRYLGAATYMTLIFRATVRLT